MAYLKYYRMESLRHATANGMVTTFENVKEMSSRLFQFFDLMPISVTLMDKNSKRFSRVKKTKSWYSSRGDREIVFHPSMLSVLTVAHEVSHYAHDVDRRKRFFAARAEADKAGRTFRWKKEKWHGPEHRKLVDLAVAELMKNPPPAWNPPVASQEEVFQALSASLVAQIPTGVTLGETTPIDPVKAFFATLPDLLTCPCCSATLPKMNFGVRVMKRGTDGQPLVMRRQSYCRSCR